QDWLDAYAESHQHPTNKGLHWLCVPVIVISLVALLATIPMPAALQSVTPWLHWGSLSLLAALAYYAVLSPALAFGMVAVIVVVLVAVAALAALPVPLLYTSIGLFVVAWIGQFIGHQIEGEKPSFFEDLQFLMIGPLWILAAIYRRAGWTY
ncbi:MAG: Mpo1-like protein, partial [Pseudomonadota bacterium]